MIPDYTGFPQKSQALSGKLRNLNGKLHFSEVSCIDSSLRFVL